MNKTKICHLSSVHTRDDIRVFHKECVSLSDHFEVYLIVADGKGDEVLSNISILDVGMPKDRIDRILFTTKKIFKKALYLDAEIYHFHDPELVFIGHKLKKKHKTIIYDIHEDVPRQILAKSYIYGPIRSIISISAEMIENYFSKEFDAIICATPHINDRFLKNNPKSFNISNFPDLKEFTGIDKTWEQRNNTICYIGGISVNRGILEMIESLKYSNCQLYLAGEFDSQEIFDSVTKDENWNRVKFFGQVDREKIVEILSSSKVGMVTLRLTPNHLDSLPIKMFEYMAAGIPVVASNFPLWKEIVGTNNCGICVDPLDPEDIANAVNRILLHKEEAKIMGENGHKAVVDKYNWNIEEQKLIAIYSELLSNKN